MRDIKFRAWDAENKTMLHPQYLSQNRKYWTWLGKKDVELMQYTGLKDKHNKEIYEGDILSVVIEGYKQAEPYIVEDMCDLYFECQREDNYYRHQIEKCEIIGNKYDNPELLEETT